MKVDKKIEYYLNEASGDPKWMKAVSQATAAAKWESGLLAEMVRDILTDANFHSESKKVFQFMKKIGM